MSDMKLWILRPYWGSTAREPWYDKAFGYVVRAATEDEARVLANTKGGDEKRSAPDAWLNPLHSTCEELTVEGEAEVVMEDFHAA